MSASPYVRYYDFFADFDHDLEFYVRQAAAVDGPVLELGCGSGRVAVGLAAAGVDVVGLDLDPAMLEAARRRAEAAGLAGACRWVVGDMVRFSLARSFALVLCPANTLFCLGGRTAQEVALGRAREHLAPGGRLVLDVFHPPVYLAEHPPDGVRRTLRQGSLPGDGRTARWTVAVRHSPAAQVLVAANEIEIFGDDGIVERHAFEEVLRYCHRHELEILLEKAGFAIEAACGWFDGRPIDDTARKVVLTARSS